MGTNTTSIKCPHCGSRLRTNGHKRQSLLYKSMIGVCTNNNCLFVARIGVEIYKEIHPSLNPNPNVKIPNRTA